MWPTGYVAVSTATAWNDKDTTARSHQHIGASAENTTRATHAAKLMIEA